MDSALVVVVAVDVVWARARQPRAHFPHTCTRASCLSRSRDACNEHVNGNSGLPDVHFGVPSSSSSSAQRHLATHCRLEGGAWQRYLPRLGWLLSDWLATPVLLSICRYCDTVCVCVCIADSNIVVAQPPPLPGQHTRVWTGSASRRCSFPTASR